MSKRGLAVVVGACLLPAAVAVFAPSYLPPVPTVAQAAAVLPKVPVLPRLAPKTPPPPTPVLARVRVFDKVRPAEAISSALARQGCGADEVSAVVEALKGRLGQRGVRAGAPYTLEKAPGATGGLDLVRFELKTLSPEGAPRTLRAEREEHPITVDVPGPTFAVTVVDAPVETVVEGVVGSVRSSLYQALLSQGEDATLVDRFVDVFAWNIDFYRQTQPGDQFRVLVEKKYAGEATERRFLGYGKVLAAEYVNAGAVYRGFLFESRDGQHFGTYDDEGNGLQRTFLKNPMEITRVTSSYGMRFHPLNKGEQMHQGIDYGAPMGTPIWTVADGVVEAAQWGRGAGNMVKIKHMNGFQTEYFHMSRFAEGVRAGTRVKQKQVIGYVGSTGSSTGPHLHFGMYKNGAHVDPSKQKFPTAAPVPKAYAGEFKAFMEPLLEQLRALDRV